MISCPSHPSFIIRGGLTPDPLALLLTLLIGLPADAAEVSVGVAANFTAPMKIIAAEFAKDTGHVAKPAFGATGFTYTLGRLVLWSAQPDYVDAKGDVLKKSPFHKIVLANPKLAPYGKSAVEVLAGMGLLDSLAPKFVQGENIAQTWQFVSTGNAKLGFVALSQAMKDGKIANG